MAAFVLLIAVPASAKEGLAGHYYLQGVMETGSELLLDEPNGFEWYLSYGALDEFAAGTWVVKDGMVVLTSKKQTTDLKHPPQAFETMTLRIEGHDLIPVAFGKGRYVRHE